ncbi:efflux RND transporter periplasmic adaptor subunit [Granulosicoccus sp. 3-233]|uniref:efflux RND transporter periplasmic adaptor subunit n=1 Tax=Granulosicoccus sp. 3-233 TaxID=3417969 RepID=UPI003D342702
MRVVSRMPNYLVVICLLLPATGAWAQETVASAASASVNTHECLMEPMVVLELGSETQGLIEVLEVDRGERVAAGDVVARLKSTVERRRVEQARKRAGMRGEITAREADLELASIVLDRSTGLHGKSLISSQELDEARAQYRVAQAALEQAQDNAGQLELEMLRAEALLEQRIVRSPVDGVVVEHSSFAGEFVQDNPIMTIAQLDPLRVEVVLPLSEFGKYRQGDTARVKPELGGPEVIAVVDVVDPLLDASSGTFGIRLLLDNADGQLIAGQKCTVSIDPASGLHTSSDTVEQ